VERGIEHALSIDEPAPGNGRVSRCEERTIDEAKLEGIRTTVKDEVHEAVERADDDGFADPSEAHLGVFAEADTDA